MNTNVFWTAERVQAQSEVWRDELMPLASTELEHHLIESTAALLAAVSQLQEAAGCNRAASERAADLAREVSAHLKTGISAPTQRLEHLENA